MERSTSSKIDAAMSAALKSISSKDQSKSSSIEKLNDYCLDQVFSYLRVDDRACCERVCQRWKKLIQDSWLNMKQLDSSKSMWDLIVQEYKLRNDNTLMETKSLSRFGQYLKDLILINSKKPPRSDLLWDICKYCPNIEVLTISNYPLLPEILLELSEHCQKIIELELYGDLPKCEKSLSKLFSNNRKLSYVCIRNFFDITGECFLHLPSAHSIVEIILNFCCTIETRWLNLALKKFINLEYLELYFCSAVDESTLQIISKLTKMRKFTFFPDCTQNLPVRALHYLVSLINLEELKLCHESLTDDFLYDVSIHCKKLKILKLHRCESITDQGIIALLENLQNLERLSLIGTRITQATLEVADQVAASRRRKLTINYSMTNSKHSIFFPKSDFLDLYEIEYNPNQYFRDFMKGDEMFAVDQFFIFINV